LGPTSPPQGRPLSSNSRHTVENQSQIGLLTDPTSAGQTVTAITDVFTASRTPAPLPTH